jgi:hypothetical protein
MILVIIVIVINPQQVSPPLTVLLRTTIYVEMLSSSVYSTCRVEGIRLVHRAMHNNNR